MSIQAQAEVNAALRGGRPLPTTESELKSELANRIASGVDLDLSTPEGAAVAALTKAIQQGQSAANTAASVAGAALAAAGAVCGPAAPVCGAVFGAYGSQLTSAIYGLASGQIAVGAGRISRKGQEANAARAEAASWGAAQTGDVINRARQEYLNRIGQYITREEVEHHFDLASKASGIPNLGWPPAWQSPYSVEEYEQRVKQGVWNRLQLLMRVVATYAAIQAERQAEDVARSMDVSAQKVAAAAQGMQQDYGAAMATYAKLFRSAGYSPSRISGIIGGKNLVAEARHARVVRALKWSAVVAMTGAGVAAAVFLPRWR